jgi:hypothetical protein
MTSYYLRRDAFTRLFAAGTRTRHQPPRLGPWSVLLPNMVGAITSSRPPVTGAAAFLMPPDEIEPDLRDLTLAKAFTLKPYWKVSAAAIVRHAYSIGAINKSRYTSLFQQISRHGYRKIEPNPLAPETPRLLRRVVDYCRSQLNYSVDELASVARLSVSEFRSSFLPDDDRPQLRVVSA